MPGPVRFFPDARAALVTVCLVGLLACNAAPTPDDGGTADGGDGGVTDAGTVDAGLSEACVPFSSGARVQGYVIDAIAIPVSQSQFAVDLNRSGVARNQFAAFIARLIGPNAAQQVADQAIDAGTDLLLVTQSSSDPALHRDSCSGSIFQPALAQAPPDFSGQGTFTADTSQSAVQITGPISGGWFEGVVSQTALPPGLEVQLPLFTGMASIPLIDVHASYVITNSGLMNGVLQGALPASSKQVIIDDLAAQLTALVQANGPSAQSIENLLDTGGAASTACGSTCENSDGGCAAAGDQRIDGCEVAANGEVQSELTPDVALFDSTGKFAPDPFNLHPDAISLGIGFTAVPATIH